MGRTPWAPDGPDLAANSTHPFGYINQELILGGALMDDTPGTSLVLKPGIHFKGVTGQ